MNFNEWEHIDLDDVYCIMKMPLMNDERIDSKTIEVQKQIKDKGLSLKLINEYKKALLEYHQIFSNEILDDE